MSETRKYCCYGLFSLEKGSVIIAIFGLIISISALFGHIWIVFNPRIATYGIPFYYHYYIEKASGISVIILVDIILNVLFNSMLIYGVSKERSAYLPPWMILYVLNLLPMFAASFFMLFTVNLYEGICFVIFTILGCYSLMVVVSTFYLIKEKENERSVQETSIEISVITPSAPVTNPRTQYLRSPSLPAYENVVSEQSTKNIETPPPNYDETVTKFHYV